MDRAQPGARGSTNRNIEFGETASQLSGGWIAPADDPTLSAQRYTSLDETAFNEFDATYSADSLTVTIDPGEAFVDGWLARDVATEFNLATDTAGQTIVLGWDPDAIYDDQQHDTRDEADEVIVAFESDVDPAHPIVAIWIFDTDETGVTNAIDKRQIGRTLSENIVKGRELAENSVARAHVSASAIGSDEVDLIELIIEQPLSPPIAALEDGESIEIPVRVDDGGTLKIYRWGAFDVSDGTAPTNLDVELLDGGDSVQISENTPDTQNDRTPVASYENTSGTLSIFKLRAKNDTGDAIDNPGIGSHFGYVVV